MARSSRVHTRGFQPTGLAIQSKRACNLRAPYCRSTTGSRSRSAETNAKHSDGDDSGSRDWNGRRTTCLTASKSPDITLLRQVYYLLHRLTYNGASQRHSPFGDSRSVASHRDYCRGLDPYPTFLTTTSHWTAVTTTAERCDR